MKLVFFRNNVQRLTFNSAWFPYADLR